MNYIFQINRICSNWRGAKNLKGFCRIEAGWQYRNLITVAVSDAADRLIAHDNDRGPPFSPEVFAAARQGQSQRHQSPEVAMRRGGEQGLAGLC